MTSKANWAGLGVAALVLALGLPMPAHEIAARAAEPGKEARGSAKDKAGWKALYDGKSLDGWKTDPFDNKAKAYVKDGVVIMETGKPMSGITYGRGDFPRTDYEVSLEGKKLAGNDFFCTTTFPVGDAFCTLVVGGWGGQVVGLSSINSMDASENETSTSKEFKPDQWYHVRIRVSKDHIQAWIDDEKLIDVDTEDKKISTRIECAPSKPFGIATWNTSGAVRNIRVRTLTETDAKK